MDIAAKQFASVAAHMGFVQAGSQAAFAPEAMPQLTDVHMSNSITNLAAAQPVPVHPALENAAMTPSSQDTQTADSIACGSQDTPTKQQVVPFIPPEEPALTPPPPKRARTETSSHMLLELARQHYGPGPAMSQRPEDQSNPSNPATPLAVAPPIALPKGPPAAKAPVSIVKASIPKPTKLPDMPTIPKFQSFQWGGFTIYHGGPRAAYRCSSYPGARETKFFTNWHDLCQHIVNA